MATHPGEVIGSQGDVRIATCPEALQIGTAFKTEGAVRLNFLAKFLYSFMPHYPPLLRRSSPEYHDPRKNGNRRSAPGFSRLLEDARFTVTFGSQSKPVGQAGWILTACFVQPIRSHGPIAG
jgi:hypothetical protein